MYVALGLAVDGSVFLQGALDQCVVSNDNLMKSAFVCNEIENKLSIDDAVYLLRLILGENPKVEEIIIFLQNSYDTVSRDLFLSVHRVLQGSKNVPVVLHKFLS